MNNWNLIAYLIYLPTCAFITIAVGRSLHKNGYFLIHDLFGNEAFAKTTNNLLLVGYYLVNLGYIALTISAFTELSNEKALMEVLSHRIGIILFILGGLHLNNIITLLLLSKKKEQLIKFFNT